MTIDYLGHSGFLIETQDLLLLFDYFRGGLATLQRKPEEKPLFVFVSHAHPDHFNPEIFTLRHERPVRFLLSFDLRGSSLVPEDAEALFLDAGICVSVPGLGSVQTLRSTDEGVAFLVDTGRESVFHAGDLHWWDWPGEDPAWLAEQERVFREEISRLPPARVDAAFLVLDDRLEGNYAKGMSRFLSVCNPRFAFPMHWTDRSVITRFMALPLPSGCDTTVIDTGLRSHWEI